MRNIRVLILDSHRPNPDVTTKALESEPDIEIVGCATRIGQARDQLVMKPCDVLLMHVTLATPDEIRFIRETVRDHSATRVVVMVWDNTSQTVLRCIQAGAAGYVLGKDPVSRLFQMIRSTHNNEAPIAPDIAALLMAQVAGMSYLLRQYTVYRLEENTNSTRALQSVDPGLSSRQWEVLELIGQGMTNMEIAAHLGIGTGTVKHHVHGLLDKLNVSRRDRAAQWLRAYRTAADSGRVKTASRSLPVQPRTKAFSRRQAESPQTVS